MNFSVPKDLSLNAANDFDLDRKDTIGSSQVANLDDFDDYSTELDEDIDQHDLDDGIDGFQLRHNSSIYSENLFVNQHSVTTIASIKEEGSVPIVASNPFFISNSIRSEVLDNFFTCLSKEPDTCKWLPLAAPTKINRKRSLKEMYSVSSSDSSSFDCPPAKCSTSALDVAKSNFGQDGHLSKMSSVSSSSANSSLHPALLLQRKFYQLPALCNPTLPERLQLRRRLIPSLNQIRRIMSCMDFVNLPQLENACDPGHPDHICLINNLTTARRIHLSLPKGNVSKKWMYHFHHIIPPHKDGDHKAERLTRQAASLLLGTTILCHHNNRALPTDVSSIETDFFNLHMDAFLIMKTPFLSSRHDRILEALPRLYVFFTELFTVMPLKGNLEVCLLLLSFLEGFGKHHQRGGKNADFSYLLYREFLEYLDEQVMPLRKRLLWQQQMESEVSTGRSSNQKK